MYILWLVAFAFLFFNSTLLGMEQCSKKSSGLSLEYRRAKKLEENIEGISFFASTGIKKFPKPRLAKRQKYSLKVILQKEDKENFKIWQADLKEKIEEADKRNTGLSSEDVLKKEIEKWVEGVTFLALTGITNMPKRYFTKEQKYLINEKSFAKHKKLCLPKTKENDVNYFSILPHEEITCGILIPQSVENASELVSLLQSITNFALSNRQNYTFVQSDYFLNKLNNLLCTISSSEVFVSGSKKMQGSVILSSFRIQQILNLIEKIKTCDVQSIRELMQYGFNPNFIINLDPRSDYYHQRLGRVICESKKNLLGFVDLGSNPEFAIELLEKGANPNVALMWEQKFFITPLDMRRTKFVQLEQLFRLLIQKGLDPNFIFHDHGKYFSLLGLALHYISDYISLIEMLLQRGADPLLEFRSSKGGSKKTAWEMAEILFEFEERQIILDLFKKYQKSE